MTPETNTPNTTTVRFYSPNNARVFMRAMRDENRAPVWSVERHTNGNPYAWNVTTNAMPRDIAIASINAILGRDIPYVILNAAWSWDTTPDARAFGPYESDARAVDATTPDTTPDAPNDSTVDAARMYNDVANALTELDNAARAANAANDETAFDWDSVSDAEFSDVENALMTLYNATNTTRPFMCDLAALSNAMHDRTGIALCTPRERAILNAIRHAESAYPNTTTDAANNTTTDGI